MAPVVPSAVARRGVVTQITLMMGVNGFLMVLSVLLQERFGYSAPRIGLSFLPFSLGVGMTSGLAAALIRKLND